VRILHYNFLRSEEELQEFFDAVLEKINEPRQWEKGPWSDVDVREATSILREEIDEWQNSFNSENEMIELLDIAASAALLYHAIKRETLHNKG
jgi:hypothetical protein